MIYLWPIYQYVNLTKLAFYYMVISLSPFLEKSYYFLHSPYNQAQPILFAYVIVVQNCFFFFVCYIIYSLEVDIKLWLFVVCTVDQVYFARYYCSRMADQNFRERVFFANGRKAVTTEDGKYPKTPKIHKKGPKTVKNNQH